MTAELVPLRTKQIVVPRLSDARREQELRDLADADTTGYITEIALRSLAHRSLLAGDGRKAREAWEDFLDAVEIASGIESGTIDWRLYGAYTTGDRKDLAWQDACEEADAALRVLLHGRADMRRRASAQQAGEPA